MKIAIPDLVSNSYFPVIAATELGICQDLGLDIELVHIFPVTRCLELLRDGEIEFVGGTAHALPQVFPKNVGGKILCALSQHMYWKLVLRPDLEIEAGNFQALKNLRIGAAPIVEQGLRGLLAVAGVDVAKNNIVIEPVPGAMGPGISFGVAAADALEKGLLDGFWANAMGSECAVRRGVGKIFVDIRRGDAPQESRGFTFPALMTSDAVIREHPAAAKMMVKSIISAQAALKGEAALAEKAASRLFPSYETSLITDVIKPDLAYFDPAVSAQSIDSMLKFDASLGIDTTGIAYADVVATEFSHLWE
jgi:NitT/TauT family transport system substrate-binding protein